MLDLPGADPWLVIWWCLLITWLLAAIQPKSSTESIRREQALGNLEEHKRKDRVQMSKHLWRCVHEHQWMTMSQAVCLVLNNFNICLRLRYIICLCSAYPSSGISMVSTSSIWIRRQSLTSSSSSGVNSSRPLTDRPGATTSAELDAVNLNNCRKKK